MPIAEARYDLIVQLGSGPSAKRFPMIVDMLETRDEGADGSPGRLRGAKLKSYEGPPGVRVTYERLALRTGPRWFLLVNDCPQRYLTKDRRYLRWTDD